MTTGTRAVGEGPAHAAVLYHSDEEFLKIVGAFIAEGLRNGEAAWVAIPVEKMTPLRDVLNAAVGDAVGNVAWTDITELGRNPGRILGAELAFLQRHQNGPVRMVAEAAWPGRSESEYACCVQHEALCNVAFDSWYMQGLCPFDASRLADSVLDDVWFTHPVVEHGGLRRSSPRYSLDAALHRSNQQLTTSPAAVTYTVCEAADLSRARQHSGRYGRLLGMSTDRIADLQLVVTELATNSLQHGGGKSHLAFWELDGHLVCEARDRGNFTDPLAGRRPPARDRPSPSGLFVVHALSDLVRTHSSADGTAIQAFLRLDRLRGEAA